MMIFFIIAAAIVVILMCREAILHKGNFFERTLGRATPPDVFWEEDDERFRRRSNGEDPAVAGLLPAEPGYDSMHPWEWADD